MNPGFVALKCVVLTLVFIAWPMPGQTISFFREFTTQWMEQASALAADVSGIYVAGNRWRPGSGQGRAGIARYDHNGTQIWAREVSAPAETVVVAIRVLPTLDGIYFFGAMSSASGSGRRFIRKYAAGVEELWSQALPGFAHAAAHSTGVYATGRDASGPYLRKFDANGHELWTRQWEGANSFYPLAITADATGLYVLATGADGSFRTPFARKYDLQGNELWTRQLDTLYYATLGADHPAGFYVSALDFRGTISLRKYSSSGKELWSRGVGTWNDLGPYAPPEVAADTTGVYIAGGNNLATGLPGYCRSGSGGHSFVRKYGPDGIELWTRQFGRSQRIVRHGSRSV